MSRAELELEAATLEPGQSIRMVCPFCGGGSSNERSLSLTHAEDGAILFHCYRAHCGASGALGGARRLKRIATPPPVRKDSRVKENIEYRLRTIPSGFLPPCWGMPDFVLHVAGVLWDEDTQRLALPIWGPLGQLRGRVLRVPPGSGVMPKTLTWMYEDVPVLSWWGSPHNESVIVVEDIPSAMRLAHLNYRAVALNGTHLSDDAVEELDSNATNVLWALDPDAVGKAIAWLVRTRMYFNQCSVLNIDKDIKDMTDTEVESWLSNISWLRSYGVGTPTTGSEASSQTPT